jgi:hypothetical protein
MIFDMVNTIRTVLLQVEAARLIAVSIADDKKREIICKSMIHDGCGINDGE